MAKTVKLKPFEKVLNVLISGKPTSKEEIDTLLGKEIQMYRISTYMWHVKTIANGVVKVIKDGRKVTAYQLINVKEVTEYLKKGGVLLSKPKAPVKSLQELKVEPVAEVAPAKQVETEVLEVTEITETENV